MHLKDKLAKKLGINRYKIKDETVKYFYDVEPQLCCKYDLKPISLDVKPYEFEKAMIFLNEYYKDIKCDYYKNLVKTASTIKNILDEKPTEDLDHVIYEYIKFRPNTFVITLWPSTLTDNDNNDNKFTKLIDLLNGHGFVYYVRKFKLSYNAAKNLIYQLYSDVWRLSTEDKIEEKLEYIGWKTKSDVMNFKIVVFEHTSKMRLSGGQAPLKEAIRSIYTQNNNDNRRGDDFLHINDHFYQTVEYCKLYLIKNSLIALHHQSLANYLKPEFKNCRVYTNTVKNWLTQNVDSVDHDRFLFISSTNLYAYGIRPCRDVDGMVGEHPVNETLKLKVNEFFSNPKTKFFFADVPMINSEFWKKEWDDKDKQWFSMIGVKNRDELIFDPKHHFYHNGLKFTTLKVDVYKRIIRSRFSDFVDLMQIKLLADVEFKLPSIPTSKHSKEEFLKLTSEYIDTKYNGLNKSQIMKVLNTL